MSDPAPIRVGVYWDLRGTRPGRRTGVGKHVVQVVTELAVRPEVQLTVLLARGQESLWEELVRAEGWNLDRRSISWSCWGLRLRSIVGLRSVIPLWAQELDVIYSPQEEMVPVNGIPVVNTLHGFPGLRDDLPSELRFRLPYIRERLKQKALMKQVSRHCAHSMVVSQTLAKEAVERLGFSVERLSVIGNGVEPAWLTASLPPRPPPESPVVLVGGANAYDGGDRILVVADAIAPRKLVVIGDRHEEPWVSQLKKKSNVEWCGFLNGDTFCDELRQAAALVMVPLAESFGMTGLEALALGVPVIALPVDGLPEVLGESVRWLRVEDLSKSLSMALTELEELSGEAYPTERIQGVEHASSYTWSSVADRVLVALRMVVESSEAHKAV